MLNSAHEESKATNMKRQIALPRMAHVPANRNSMQVHEPPESKMKQGYSLD